ncbi:unnamed protein product [Calypogeia fissa]
MVCLLQKELTQDAHCRKESSRYVGRITRTGTRLLSRGGELGSWARRPVFVKLAALNGPLLRPFNVCMLLGVLRVLKGNLSSVLSSLSITKDGPAVLLATVGRGITSYMKKLSLRDYFADALPTKTTVINNAKVSRMQRFHEFLALRTNISSNTDVEELDLCRNSGFGNDRTAISLLARLLETNSSLQCLQLSFCNVDSEGARCLMEGLKRNTTLASLDLSGNKLGRLGHEVIGEFLSKNHTLKCIDLSDTSLQNPDDFSQIARALECNTTLEDLSLAKNRIRPVDLKRLLQPLSYVVGEMTSSSSSPKNTTLTRLDLSELSLSTDEYPHFVECVATMVRTNRALCTLVMGRTSLSAEDWKGQLFAALRDNETLQELDLSHCTGITDDAYQDLIYLLQLCDTGLRGVNLLGSDIQFRQGQVDEEIRVNLQYRDQLKGQMQVQTTSGRLVLCGYEFAGKTAIRKTMERIENGTPCGYPLSLRWKKSMEAVPGVRSYLFGRDAYLELTARTRGVDILFLQKQTCLASVWDFAGQREYYALHDYLFPNVINSCFLYVCSCRCPPDLQNRRGKVKDHNSMRAECEYWMRFIASNSKPRHHGDHRGPQLPHVRFVLTRKDTLDSDALRISRQQAEDVVEELRNKFQDVINLCETVEVVNAHSSKDVERLIALTDNTLKEILEHQTEYAVCPAVRSAMETWSAENRSKPVMTLTEFRDMCRRQVHPLAKVEFYSAHLNSIEGQETVLAYLNDTGDLIFPKPLDFIVANPRWFGVGVLGSLIDAFGGCESRFDDFHHLEQRRCTGVLARPKRFWKLHHKDGFVERRNIKSLLKHSLQTMNLEQIIPANKLILLMIQLELCFEKEPENKESSLFIPALLDDEMDSAARGRLQLEWRLERTGSLHYLGRRLECKNKALTFLTPGFFPRLQVHLRNYIHERNWTANPGFEVGRNLICFANNGVEGVLLVEGVIRPACVKALHICVDRKAHSVLVSDLKAMIAEDDAYEYTWTQKIEDVKDTDFARDLLEGEGSHINLLAASQSNVVPSSGTSISRHGDERFSSVELQLPKLFYPSVEDIGWLRKLDQMLNVAKVMPIKLHLMCDHKHGSHKVEGQPGRTIRLKWKADSYDLPLAKYALTLLWAGIGVGTTIAGAPVRSVMVDNWVQNLFNEREMPDITAETLKQLMRKGESSMPASEQEILKALERYMRIDPHTEGLKKILNLQDGDKFWEDFRLRKVVYTEGSHLKNVGLGL